MPVTIEPLTPTIGARVTGVDAPLRQLMGRHRRLARELSAACAQPLLIGRINRLAAEVAAAEQEIGEFLGADGPAALLPLTSVLEAA